MKKQFYTLFLLIVILSCKKESTDNITEPIEKNELTVHEARSYIGKALPENKIRLTRKTPDGLESTGIAINWTAAGQFTSDEYSYIEVPIETNVSNLNLYALDGEDQKDDARRAAYSYSTVLIYRDNSDSAVKSHIVTYLPDISYIKNHGRIINRNRIADLAPDFSGYIEYNDLAGKAERVFRIKDGRLEKTMSLEPVEEKTVKSTRSVASAATTASCQQICIPVFQTVCTGPGGGNGPREKDQICTTRQIGFNCQTVCTGGGPTGPPPGGGGGEGGGDTGGSGGTNPDVKNKVTDPCLKVTVDQLLNNNNIEGTIAEILNNFQSNNDVDLTITEGATQDNKIAQIGNTKLDVFMDPNHTITRRQYKAEITVNQSMLSTISKEGVAAAIVHEVLHAYLDYNRISFDQAAAQHNYIASNYVGTLSAYLQGKYSVPPNDAVALSWAGLGNSELFKNAQTFQMPDGTTMSKDDMGHLSGDYFGGLDKPNKGTPLCQ